MRSQVTRKMPFTEEQMQKIYNTNIIDFAREHGFEVEKGDKATLHVKNSGGLYLFKHGRVLISLQGKGKAASWEQFPVTVHGISIKD